MNDLEVDVMKSGVHVTYNWKACGNLGVGYDNVKTLPKNVVWKNLLERPLNNLQGYWKEISFAYQEKTSLATSNQNDFSICNDNEMVSSQNTSIFQFPQRLLLRPINAKLDNITRL